MADNSRSRSARAAHQVWGRARTSHRAAPAANVDPSQPGARRLRRDWRSGATNLKASTRSRHPGGSFVGGAIPFSRQGQPIAGGTAGLLESPRAVRPRRRRPCFRQGFARARMGCQSRSAWWGSRSRSSHGSKSALGLGGCMSTLCDSRPAAR